MNVLCAWNVPQLLREHFNSKLPGNINMIYPENNDVKNLISLAKNNQVEMIIGWRPTTELLKASPCLKLMQNPGAGVQHLIEIFREFPAVQLANCHGNAYFTAQHSVALLMALLNNVILHHQNMQRGLWRRKNKFTENIPLRNKTIGLLGYGQVGKHIARFFSGYDIELVACKRKALDHHYPNITKVFSQNQLPTFFDYCDIIIVTLPLTKETKGLINKHLLLLLGENGIIVNMGRGEIIHEQALYDCLKSNNIKAAALDVWWNEGIRPINNEPVYPYNLPFHTLNNVVMSPHRAASPMSDLDRWDDVITNIINLRDGLPLLNLVDINSGY